MTSSSSVKDTATACGTGRVALGAGAGIYRPIGEQPEPFAVGLHVVRPSATGDITRSTAKEWPGGYSGDWRVRSHAICANAPRGYEVRATTTTGRHANAWCTGDRQILGAGAAADAPLTGVLPAGAIGATAVAPRNGAQSGFLAAYATCADTVLPPSPSPQPPCPPQVPDCHEP